MPGIHLETGSKKHAIAKVRKGSGILDENGVSLLEETFDHLVWVTRCDKSPSLTTNVTQYV